MRNNKQYNSHSDNLKEGYFYPLFSFNFCVLCIDKSGRFWLIWNIPKEYDRFKNEKITWFNCFWRYNLCKKNLRRIHLTCLRCKLRKVVTGELPILQQVTLHILPLQLQYDGIHRILVKKLLSVAEALT
jgi:hypothetical protein